MARGTDAEITAIAAAIRRGDPVDDLAFDDVFPDELRGRSEIQWTPVEVARRAGELLALAPGARVLDVGAGVGKACLVGMLVSPAQWWGVEQDPRSVAAARTAAYRLGVDARFVEGDATSVDWDHFAAFYFYNPFGVLALAPTVSAFTRHATIRANVRAAEARLARCRVGTRVVTYHGFGGAMPPGYELVAREPAGGDELQLWIQREAMAADAPVA